MADTDPRDADSVLRITRITVDLTGTEIHWQGGVEAVQYLERRLALDGSAGDWEVLQTVNPPTPTTNVFRDPSTGNVEAYYRIRAEQP